jgi:Lrp/AsnC family transcriptional regulator, leucine-responsive regulatory protein
VRSLLQECPEIIECDRVTGNDHYLAKVVVVNISHLQELIDRFIPFATVTTSIVLSTPVDRRIIKNDIFPKS